jgi:hypothetical protein
MTNSIFAIELREKNFNNVKSRAKFFISLSNLLAFFSLYLLHLTK